MLSLCLYVITLPFLTGWLNHLIPGITFCPYLAMTSQPCPFCGMTRYMNDIWTNGVHAEVAANPFFLMLAAFLVLQVAFRITALCIGNKKHVIWADCIISGMMVLAGVSYIIFYFNNV